MNMNYSSSIFIPRMGIEHTFETVSFIMDLFNIGQVIHVQFIPFKCNNGKYNTFVKSAIVYFSQPTKTHNNHFWKIVATQRRTYKLDISEKHHWICYKSYEQYANLHYAYTPTPTDDNILQIKSYNDFNRRLKVLENKLSLLEQDFTDYFIV